MDNLLRQALNVMVGRDPDRVRTLNGIGFNAYDSDFGHKMADCSTWSPRQALAVWKLLAKYRAQLASAGIDYAAIPQPTIPDDANNCRLTWDDGTVLLSCPYSATLVAAIRELPRQGRKWNATAKVWEIVPDAENVPPLLALAERFAFAVSPQAREGMEQARETKAAQQELSQAAEPSLSIPQVPATQLGGTLRPFQTAGVQYCLQAQRTFICDEMGLGKTVEALATLAAADAFPAIIICPASLKLNWEREARKWLPGKTVAVWNGGVNRLADVIVVNYDILSKMVTVKDGKVTRRSDLEPKAVVLDESHYAKNYKAQRTAFCKAIAHKVPIRLALTGTPVLNRPHELISQLQILGRLDDLGGFWGFAKRYCDAKQGSWGWDFSGAANLAELNDKLRSTCYVRRTKAEVLTELPAKQRTNLSVPIDNREEYERAVSAFLEWLQDNVTALTGSAKEGAMAAASAARAEQLVKIESLKQLCARGKLAAALDWIGSFLETEQKLVVFATHQEIVHRVAAHFGVTPITGETPLAARQKAVDAFQNDPASRLIVMNTKVGGLGLTLTAASNVAFLELGWNPAEHDQAEDRCHRIGQQNAVNAWYLLASGTIDDDIYRLIEQKRVVVNASTEGGQYADVEMMNQLVQALAAPKL